MTAKPTVEELTSETGSSSLMPCGSNHSCFDCNNWYFGDGCTWIERMSEDEFDKHKQGLELSKQLKNHNQ